MNNEINTPEISYLENAGYRLAIRHNPPATRLISKPAANSAPRIIFCGGFHSSMQGSKAQALADFCTGNNLAYTRFDYRGHGASDGDPHAFTMLDWLEDTLQVVDICDHPAVLVGSSMGAWLATLATLRRSSQIKGLLLLAAAPDFLQELIEPNLTPAQIWDLQQDQVVSLPNDHDSAFPLTRALLDSANDLSVLQGEDIKKLLCPIRLLHGTGDTDVPFDLSIRLMGRIAHDQAQLTLLHKADHRLSDKPSLERIKRELTDLIDIVG